MGQIRYDDIDAETGTPPAPMADLWMIAPVLLTHIMQAVAEHVPDSQAQRALAIALAQLVGGYIQDLKDEANAAWKIVDELHRANQVMARQLDALQDRGVYVKGGRR